MRVRAIELVTLASTIAIAAGCGGGSEGTSSDTTPRTSLRIEVRAAPEAPAQEATLTCDGRSAATGFIADARAACAVLTRDALARAALLERPSAGRICTQVYGGPQRARVTGWVDGRDVDVTVTRADGCGIADWSRLEPLLGPPG